MPPLVLWMLGALGGAAAAAVLARETKRINAELDAEERSQGVGRDESGHPIRTLKRDPKTGVYRPH